MRRGHFHLFTALLAGLVPPLTLAQTPGSFADGGNTQVSAMMMFLGNSEKVYILDKAEGNAAQVNGHPAWGAVWDIGTHQATVMDVRTNVFCASGMHLPNGSYVTFGGNGAVGPGGNIGSQVNPGAGNAVFDSTYQDYDGTKAIRVLNPCTNADDFTSPQCQWFDNPAVLSMQSQRWYSAAEALANGTVVLIGGFTNGGYINRNYPNNDPTHEGGAANPTYEFYPGNGQIAQNMVFMTETSGLNSYAHTYLLASGKMFVQANISTIIWDYNANVETPLPNMPNNVARVYPASGAVAMLPLTLANNYTQTIIFCGGNDMPDEAWGNYSFPAINTWDYPASNDCQRITPEPADGSAPAYEQDDSMLDRRTMGQFIILPNGKLLVINGGNNGTAGYATATGQTPSLGFMPYGESLAAGPVGTPSIYDPDAPAGSRWSSAGLSSSNIPRLYHSSAILLPDSSVLVAGSNPNVDVNLTTVYPTTYEAEIFYPSYFSASTRPTFTGCPSTLTYGGTPFDLIVPSSAYSGSADDAAANTTVAITRGGFTTHAMNMGQRYMQLNNTYTVNSNGSITLHVAQPPPNPNLFQPGPALLWVVIDGIPSNATMLIVGNGQISQQQVLAVTPLPPSTQLSTASGTGGGPSDASKSKTRVYKVVGGIVGVIAIIAVVGVIGMYVWRRRDTTVRKAPGASYAMGSTGGADMGIKPMGIGAGAGGMYNRGMRDSDSSSFVPLEHENASLAWDASRVSFDHVVGGGGGGGGGGRYGQVPGSPMGGYAPMGAYSPYRDDMTDHRASGTGMSADFDPYTRAPRSPGGPRY